MNAEKIERFARLKIFLFDLDGVLVTDKNSDESALLTDLNFFCSELNNRGLKAGIVTARENDTLVQKILFTNNCVLINSAVDKFTPVQKLLAAESLEFANLFYAGDDLLDLPLLSMAGFSAAPHSAKREVKRSVMLVLKSNGVKILHEVLGLIENYLKKEN